MDLKKYLFVLGLMVLFVWVVSANVDQYAINYYIPGGQIGPNITSWGNSKTNDNNINININVGEVIKFNIVADQSIGTWRWYKDGIIQTNNYNNFTTSWSTTGSKIISVNGTNINGTTNTVIWTITVLNQMTLSSCGNLNKANYIYVLNSSVSSNGTCFTIGANNVTLDGKGNNVNYATTATGYGISDTGGYDNINVRNLALNQQNAAVANAHGMYLRNVINSRADNINITTKNNAEGLYLSSSNSNIFSNLNIQTTNTGAYGIYLTSSNSNSFSGCNIGTAGSNSDGIYIISSSNSNSFSGCNITTMGGNGDGIYMTSSNYNSYSGSNILTSGNGANGIWVNTNANYNNFSNNNILAGGSGIRLNSASSNIVKGGSIISNLVNDYYLQNSNTNNFINTNFTTRKIYLNDNSSIFNYANNNIALNTKQIVSPTKVLTITRTLVNWDQANITWQEKLSVARMLNYGMGGLLPNSKYSVWNGSILNYNLTTDSNGNIPNFSINLTTLAKSIRVVFNS